LFKKSIKTLTPKMQEVEMEYKHEQYAKLPDITKYNFDNELENVSKPVWKPLQTTTRYGPSNHSRQAAFNYGDDYWQEPEMDPVKKSSEQLDEVVTTIILEIESDDKCEASICEYYAKFESKHSHYLVEDLIYGRAEDDEYERVISQMLHNDFFLSTPEGKYFESFVTDKCKQNKTTIDNVKNALFNYEIGETVQSMVDEAIL